MLVYVEIAKRSFRRYSTYRGATLAGLFTNTVFGFLKTYVLLALYSQRQTIGGLDAAEAVTFTWLAQGLIATIAVWGGLEISERIRSGDIVSDLYRPVDFQGYWLAHDLGRGAFHALLRGVPPFIVAALFFRVILPAPTALLAFGLAAALGVVVSFAIRFLVSLTAFWLLEDRGAQQLAVVFATVLTGLAVPLTFFPEPLGDIARALPWAACLQLPAEVFLGKHTGTSLLAVFALQLGWALALLVLGRKVLAAATRKVVVHGG
jgi:ABC-2 type transport system permease protein